MGAAPWGASHEHTTLGAPRSPLLAQPRHKSQLSSSHNSQLVSHKSQLGGGRSLPLGARAMATRKDPAPGSKPKKGSSSKPRDGSSARPKGSSSPRPKGSSSTKPKGSSNLLPKDGSSPLPREGMEGLGREAEEQRRQEFVYGPHGPYSNRAPVEGKAQGPNLAAPFLSCMFSSVKTDEEQEEIDQARMCHAYEKALRRYRGRARARARKGLPPVGPISYFFAFVAKSPPPPSTTQLWEGWTLVAQLAVEHPNAKAPAEPQSEASPATQPQPPLVLPPDSSAAQPMGASSQPQPMGGGADAHDSDAMEGGRGPSGAPEGGQGLEAGPVDRWELPGRMSGRAMQQLMECVGWHRPDLVYTKKPALELRFELQEDFFRGLAIPPEPSSAHGTTGAATQDSDNDNTRPAPPQSDNGIQEASPRSTAGTPGASPQETEVTRGSSASGAAGTPGPIPGDSGSTRAAGVGDTGGAPGANRANRALQAEGVLAEVCRALGLDPWMEPSAEAVAEEFKRAPGRRQAQVLRVVFEAALGEGGTWPELLQAKGAPPLAFPESVQPPAAVAMPGDAPFSDTRTEGLESAVDSSGGVPESQGDEESVDTPEGDIEGIPRVAGRRLERVSLTGKARFQGALGKGTWSVAICPYDYKRLVFEVCTFLKDIAASPALP